MPSQRRSRGQAQSATTSRAESSRSLPEGTGKQRVFVLGAGVDLVYGIPVMSSLLRELAAFAKGDGRPIHAAIRKKLPGIKFTFDRYAGDQGDQMLRQLFSSDSGNLVNTLRSTAQKLQTDPEAASIGPVLDKLCNMAENNQLSGEDAVNLARFAGDSDDVGDGEAVLDPDRITLTRTAAQALRRAFVRALQSDSGFDETERQTLEYFVEATSNVEELMSLYFMRYSLGKAGDQKSFLYIAWMLWAFLRLKSVNRPQRDKAIYPSLRRLGGDIITFNYTSFFDSATAKRVIFFHGRLSEVLMLDSRELIRDTPAMKAATTVEGVVQFIGQMRLDVARAPAIDIPALVPPTSFKPVLSRAQLRSWADADGLLQRSAIAVVVGYSFALADEHFNDMLRHANPKLRVVVVNPDIVATSREAARVLGLAPESLTTGESSGFETRRAERLVCIAAKAEDVSEELLTAVM